MIRPEFWPVDISAMAGPSCERSTVDESSAWRAGMISTNRQPERNAVTATCHGWTRPVAISSARITAISAVSPWAVISTMRRSKRSTTTPATSARISIGRPRANETIPSQVGELVRS